MTRELEMAGLSLEVPSEWKDTTNTQPTQTPTLAKQNGIGALQFTVARYLTGPAPRLTADDAANLLSGFLSSGGIKEWPPIKIRRTAYGLTVAMTDIAHPQEYIRAWCVTDGENSAIATYLTLRPGADGFREEFLESGQIVSSIRFPNSKRTT